MSDSHSMPYKPYGLGATARNEFQLPRPPRHTQHSSMARASFSSNARTIPPHAANPDWQWCNNGEQNPECLQSELLQTSFAPSSARDREDVPFVARLTCYHLR